MVAGSFFEPLPAGADVYVLSSILHDCPDSEATAILRRCAEATGPSGRVLVVEQVLDDADDMAGMTAFDLFMLICCGGRQRTLDEFRTLGVAAGLSLRSVLQGPMLEFVKARRLTRPHLPAAGSSASMFPACFGYARHHAVCERFEERIQATPPAARLPSIPCKLENFT